jgi:hypothetical protein
MGTSINTFFASISFADCLLNPFVRITALRSTGNLAVYCILSRLLRSMRLWCMNNAIQRIILGTCPLRVVLHPKLCIYRSSLINQVISKWLS